MSETSVKTAAPAGAAYEYSLLAKLGAEALGTFMLVLAGVGVALFSPFNSGGAVPLSVGLAFGIALLGGIAAFGHISGAHFNPAVTLALALVGRVKWLQGLYYWIAQVIGASAAGFILWVLLKSNTVFGTEGPTVQDMFLSASNTFGEAGSFGTWKLAAALLIEAVATAIFVGVILSLTSPKHPAPSQSTVAIPLTLAVMIMVAIPVTNAGLNPARSTATAIFAGSAGLSDLWLFWVAPLVGALIAALLVLGFTPQSSAVHEELARLEAQLSQDDDAAAAQEAAQEVVAAKAAAPNAAAAKSATAKAAAPAKKPAAKSSTAAKKPAAKPKAD